MSDEQHHICHRGERRQLFDARGIFCCYVCDTCEERKRRVYRMEIFTDPNYSHDEPIDED